MAYPYFYLQPERVHFGFTIFKLYRGTVKEKMFRILLHLEWIAPFSLSKSIENNPQKVVFLNEVNCISLRS
jgi:hypothetical protein